MGTALTRRNFLSFDFGDRRGAAEPAAVSATLFDLLQRSVALHSATAGAFDVTSTPLSRCWGFLQREGRLPEPEVIEAARSMVGMPQVQLDAAASTVRFARQGVELNFG